MLMYCLKGHVDRCECIADRLRRRIASDLLVHYQFTRQDNVVMNFRVAGIFQKATDEYLELVESITTSKDFTKSDIQDSLVVMEDWIITDMELSRE